MATQTASGRGNTPPYVSYPSFKTLISELHEHDVPSRIDRSVLRRFSGIVGTQLLTALRFLRLIDDKSTPTPLLHELVTAFGTPEWGTKMISVLQAEYAPLFGLDLGNATAAHFDETFRKAFPSKDSVAQKSVVFFLAAAKDSGIIVSDRVMHGRKLRTGSTPGTPRTKKPKTDKQMKQQGNGAIGEDDEDNDGKSKGTWEDRLIDKFPPFNPEWDASVQAKWFESFEKLMALRK
jgi:hypothetical protein